MDWALTTSLAALMSGLGACASAFATRRTLHEMQKQREASYLPQIGCAVPPIPSTKTQEPMLTLFNVGLGTARDVDVSMSMPFDFLPALNERMKDHGRRVWSESNILHWVDTQPDSDGWMDTSSVSVLCNAHIQFLMSGADHGIQLRMPPSLHELIALLSRCRFPEDTAWREILGDLHLDIRARFSDMDGRRHIFQQRYTFDFADYDVKRKRLTAHFA